MNPLPHSLSNGAKRQIQSLLEKFNYKIIRVHRANLADSNALNSGMLPAAYHAYYHGIDFLCPTESILGQWVLSGHTWDEHLTSLIERCRQGQTDFTICEVGSNIGASIVPVMVRFPDFNYILVEASPHFVQFLKQNTAFFNQKNLEIHSVLLSDSSDAAETLVENNSTGGRTRQGPYGIDREYKLPTSTLDNLIGAQRIDFLKIDTDGFEFPILRGATQLLQRCKPYLLVEFTPDFLREQGENPQEFLNWLLQFGYNNQIEVFDNFGKPLGKLSLEETLQVAENSPNQAGYVDLLLSPEK